MLSTSSSQAEGRERDWAVLSKEFLKDDSGALRGVRAVRAEWSEGRPDEVPGSEFELAMGFLHPEHPVLDSFGEVATAGSPGTPCPTTS